MNEFEAAAEKMKQRRAGALGMALTYDERDPDAAAKSLQVGTALGIPPLLVDAEPEAFDARLRMKQAAEALKDAPLTAKWLSDINNGVLTKDDLDNLTWFEKGLRDFAIIGAPYDYGARAIGRAGKRGVLNLRAAAPAAQALATAAQIGDAGKTLEELSADELARMGPAPYAPEQIGIAQQQALMRRDLAKQDTKQLLREGTEYLTSARDFRARAAELPKSGPAQRAAKGMDESDGTLMGVLRAAAGDPLGVMALAAESAAEFLPVLAAATGATLATRSPAAGVAAMTGGSFLVENSASAMDFLAEKQVDLSTPEAVQAALQNTELMREAQERGLTRGVVVAMFDGLSGGIAGKALLKSPIGDAVAQGFAQMVLGAGGEGAAQQAAGQKISWQDIVIEGLAELATAPVEVLGVGGRRVLGEASKAVRGDDMKAKLAEIDAMAAASKLKERAPDKFADALEAQGQDAIYVPADALKEYFQAKDVPFDDQMMIAWGIDPRTFDEAVSAGQDVAVPVSSYAAFISGTDDAAWFAANGSSDPQAMSAAQAKEFNEKSGDALQQAFEEEAEARAAEEESRSASAQIYDQMFSQLRAAGRSPEVAKAEALTWAAFWRTQGARMGEDPLDLTRAMGVDVVGPQSPERQRARDTMDIALNTLRNKGVPKPTGMSLAEFVRAKGGVQDDGGDVAVLEGKGLVAETADEIKARRSQPTLTGQPSVGKGVTLEDMARMAAEAGYFPDLLDEITDGTAGEATDLRKRLLEALSEDVAGRKVYPDGEGPNEAMQALADDLARRGVDLSAVSNDEAVAALQSEGTEYGQDGGRPAEPDEAAAAILAAIKDSAAEYDHVGLRITEEPLTVGETVPPSRVWDDGEPTEDVLDGASAIGIDLTLESIVAALRQAGAVERPLGGYFGRHVSVVGSDFSSAGVDRNELVLKDAKVIATFEREGDMGRLVLPGGRAEMSGRSYDQSGRLKTDTPAFHNWFGDSKVVDADGKPVIASFDQIREAAAKFGTVYVRWSAGPQYDMKPGAVSRDYASGEVHGGLSAVPITDGDSDATIFRMLRDYSYLTGGGYENNRPHIYAGDVVGKDSDGAPSIRPSKFLGSLSDSVVSFIGDDKNLDRINAASEVDFARRGLAALETAPDDWNLKRLYGPDKLKAAEDRLASLGGAPEMPSVPPKDQRILYQQNRASVVFPAAGMRSGKTVINLFETADLSSFLHESSHVFLEAFTTLASTAEAPQQMKDDLAAIRKWVGNNGEPWTVPQHEQFARGGEAYFMEGNAPSLELADAFSRFKAWLTRIYRSLAGLNVKITPEIREVMDRMLATDAEIAEARAAQGMRPLFTEAPPGMSDHDFATYQRMARRSVEQAEAALLDKTMAKVRREKEAWFRDEKRAVRAEVSAEFDKRREYRLIDMLANQVWIGSDDAVEDAQIDRKQLVEQFGAGVLPEISRTRLGGKRAIYGDNGKAIESVADFFGFASPGEMISVLQNTTEKKRAITAEVDRRMVERHGDPLHDGSIEAEALLAIHSEQQMSAAVAEARHIAKRLGRSTRTMQAKLYRQRARLMVGRMAVRDVLRPTTFLAAERKAAKAAEAAFAKVARGGKEGDLAIALQAKEQQILNGYIYDEAIALQREVERGREKMRAYDKKAVREKLGDDYIKQIDAILDDYDFRQRSGKQIARSESLKAFVDRMIEEGREADLAIDERLMDAAHRKHYTKLSVDEIRGLFDTIDNLDHLGRFKQKLIDAKRKRELLASAEAVAGQVKANLGTGKAGKKNAIVAFFNLLWRTDTLLVRMDGGAELGSAYDEIKRGIDEATSLEQAMQVDLATKLDDLFSAHYSAKEIAAMQKARNIAGANGRPWAKLEILSVALNLGNEDNFQRLTDKTAHVQNRLTREQVDALMSQMTAKDWQFVQDMWNLVNGYWPGLAEVAKRRTGVTPKKVDAKMMVDAPAFVTGGYYPIKYDAALSAAAAADEASGWDKFTSAGRGATAAVRNGMTKQRQKSGNGRTLKLDMSAGFAHLRDTVRYIALSEEVDNAYRVITHPDVTNAFLDAGASDQHTILKLWLKDVASGPAPSHDPVNTAARIIKNNFTLSKLALNLKTVALQTTGALQSAAVIGKRNMIAGYAEYLKNPTATAAAVIAKSPFMAERRSTFTKDIHDFLTETEIAGPVSTRYKKGKAAVAKVGFAPIVMTQFWAVDVPTWLGAFRLGVEKYKDEAKAIHFADRMVARSQDSGLMADRSAIERGTLSETSRQQDYIRLFTTLGGYMLTKMNRAYVTGIQARAGWKEAGPAQKAAVAADAAGKIAMLYLAETVLLMLVYSLMTDEEDDEDKRNFLMQQTGSSLVAGIPFIRDAMAALQGYGGGGVYGSVMEAPGQFFVQASQGEMDKPFRRALADLVGIGTGLPTTATMRAIEGALDNDAPMSEMIFGSNPLTR